MVEVIENRSRFLVFKGIIFLRTKNYLFFLYPNSLDLTRSIIESDR